MIIPINCFALTRSKQRKNRFQLAELREINKSLHQFIETTFPSSKNKQTITEHQSIQTNEKALQIQLTKPRFRINIVPENEIISPVEEMKESERILLE